MIVLVTDNPFAVLREASDQRLLYAFHAGVLFWCSLCRQTVAEFGARCLFLGPEGVDVHG